MAARTAAITAGEAAPAATATLQSCEAWSMIVLLGGGALLEPMPNRTAPALERAAAFPALRRA